MKLLLYDAVRFFLAFTLFLYGFSKTVGDQFVTRPTLHRTPVADLTGQQLMWYFFGYSKPYYFFIGAVQLLAAGLLLVRRTAPLGAVLLLPVIGNIVLVDICYSLQPDWTGAAIAVLVGNVLVLAYERARVRRALMALATFSSDDEPERPRRWQIAWSVALGIILMVFVALTILFVVRLMGYPVD